MKTTIILLISLSSLFISTKTIAQTKNEYQTTIKFDKTEHDFGTIKSEGGVVNHTFTFKNTGNKPLIIYHVNASCGCTTPDWSKEPVAPGNEAFIKVTFNPKGRLNNFAKTITAIVNTPDSPIKLQIKGFIQESEKSIEEIYPIDINGLRFKTLYVNISQITNTEQKTQSIEFANNTDKDIKIELEKTPKHLKAEAKPQIIKPKQKGIIEVTYDAKEKNDWDYVTDRFKLILNGEKIEESNKNITVGATIEPDFSKLTETEMKNAPKIEFEVEKFNFDTIAEGKKATFEYKFKNTGKSDLKIYKISSNCGCAATSSTADVIKPNQEASVNVTFDSRAKRGRQYKTITIINNDPQASKKVLVIVGYVK